MMYNLKGTEKLNF